MYIHIGSVTLKRRCSGRLASAILTPHLSNTVARQSPGYMLPAGFPGSGGRRIQSNFGPAGSVHTAQRPWGLTIRSRWYANSKPPRPASNSKTSWPSPTPGYAHKCLQSLTVSRALQSRHQRYAKKNTQNVAISVKRSLRRLLSAQQSRAAIGKPRANAVQPQPSENVKAQDFIGHHFVLSRVST